VKNQQLADSYGHQHKEMNRNAHRPFFLASGRPTLNTASSELITRCHVDCDGQAYFRPSGVL